MQPNHQSRGAGRRVKIRPAWLILCAVLASPAFLGCNNARSNTRAGADPFFGPAVGPSATQPAGNTAAAPVPAGSLSNAALVNPSNSGQPPSYQPVGSQPTGYHPGTWPPGQPYPPTQPTYPHPAAGQPYQAGQPGYPPTPPSQPGYPPAAPGQPVYPPTAQPGHLTAQPLQPNYGPPANPAYPNPAYPNPANPPAATYPPGYMPGQRVVSYDQAQAYLATLGTKYQRLESGDGEWRFACSIPRRDNPAISRTYEGRATTYLAAVQAVLDQINQDRP